jgi:hypothetical protein
MNDWLAILGAFAVFVLPLVLAWWLLGRREGPRQPTDKGSATHEKMPR